MSLLEIYIKQKRLLGSHWFFSLPIATNNKESNKFLIFQFKYNFWFFVQNAKIHTCIYYLQWKCRIPTYLLNLIGIACLLISFRQVLTLRNKMIFFCRKKNSKTNFGKIEVFGLQFSGRIVRWNYMVVNAMKM